MEHCLSFCSIPPVVNYLNNNNKKLQNRKVSCGGKDPLRSLSPTIGSLRLLVLSNTKCVILID